MTIKFKNCKHLSDFVHELNSAMLSNNITGIAVVLIEGGTEYSTHQFGMDTADLTIAADLMELYPILGEQHMRGDQ
jgi:hypothetical protein